MYIKTKLSELATRTANKVGMQMRCATTARDHASARRLVDDSLFLTLQLLDRIDPVEFRDGYLSNFQKYQNRVERFDKKTWQSICIGHCDVLRNQGVQERLIAELGTEMSRWQGNAVTLQELGESMNKLACFCSFEAERVVKRVTCKGKAQLLSGSKAASNPAASAFSNSVGALAIMVDATEEPAIPSAGNHLLEAMTCFAASLLVTNIELIG